MKCRKGYQQNVSVGCEIQSRTSKDKYRRAH